MELLLLLPLLVLVAYWLLPLGDGLWERSRAALWDLFRWPEAVGQGLGRAAALADREWERNARRREVLAWFEQDSAGEYAESLDEQVLKAWAQAPRIRRLVQEELPNKISLCVKTHRLAALAVGATYVKEIAHQPVCLGMRRTVIEKGQAAVAVLESYALLPEDFPLIQTLIVIRSRILPTCRGCPYLQCRTDQLPLLCPSAETVGIQPENMENHEERT